MDAEFILVSIDTKNSMKEQELVEKSQLFQRVLKMGIFGQTSQGEPFAKFSKLAIFLAQLGEARKSLILVGC